MTYIGPRKCDCGCRRPAALVVERWDLAFASACADKWQEAERQLETVAELETVDA